jgi:hypothetical protein
VRLIRGEQAMFLGDPDYVFEVQGTDFAAVTEVCRAG